MGDPVRPTVCKANCGQQRASTHKEGKVLKWRLLWLISNLCPVQAHSSVYHGKTQVWKFNWQCSWSPTAEFSPRVLRKSFSDTSSCYCHFSFFPLYYFLLVFCLYHSILNFFYVHECFVCICEYMCTTCMSGALRGQKRALDSWNWSYGWVLGMEAWLSAKAN